LTIPEDVAAGETRLVVGVPTPQSELFVGMMVSCTVALPLPPAPEHVSVYE